MSDAPSAASPRDSLRPFSAGISRFAFFVSYGDDAEALKSRVKRLIEDALRRQLSLSTWPTELVVWDWRDMAAEQAPPGGKTNDLFVQRARESSATIVMLLDRMPPGTKEELLAVIGEEEVDLKVIWLNKRRFLGSFRRPSEVSQFLSAHKNDFAYVELSELDSEATWITLTSNLVSLLLKALKGNHRQPFVEARGTS